MLNSSPRLNKNALQLNLNTVWLGKRIIHKKVTPSTQTIAHKLAKENAAHGTIVIADKQTDGKGQMNRPFYSKTNQGLWMSIIIRPKISPIKAPQLTLMTATVLADMFNEHMNIRPQIKWPNDLLIQGKKVAGILTEMHVKKNKIDYVIVGIGLNVNQSSMDMHEHIKHRATSLCIETNKMWNITNIFKHLLLTFEETYSRFMSNGFPFIKNKWESYGYKINESILIRTPNRQPWQTTFLGVAGDGALLTKTADGEIEKIYSAEIDWFKEDF